MNDKSRQHSKVPNSFLWDCDSPAEVEHSIKMNLTNAERLGLSWNANASANGCTAQANHTLDLQQDPNALQSWETFMERNWPQQSKACTEALLELGAPSTATALNWEQNESAEAHAQRSSASTRQEVDATLVQVSSPSRAAVLVLNHTGRIPCSKSYFSPQS